MAWWVARKEALSTLRDRRALVSNLLIPILVLPTVMLGLPLALGGLFEREQEARTPVVVEALNDVPRELADMLNAANVELVASEDALRDVREDVAAVGLIVPPDLPERLAAGEVPEVTILQKVGNLQSELAAGKVQVALSQYRQGLVAERLMAAGLDVAVLEPVAVRTVDASRPEERSSGQLSWLIPFFIAVWALTGGQMVALDATAGEKERGTLEALLVAPIRRSEVVVGKFLATVASGLSASFMAIAGVLLGGVLMRRVFLPNLGEDAAEMVAVMGGTPTIGVEGLWALLGSAVLLAGAVAAVLLAVATFARSFKEAQTYVAPLSMVMIVPALALQFADLLDLGARVYFVPVMNVMVLMDDVLQGSVRLADVAVTWLVMLALLAALLTFAWRTFLREDVIFRS